MARYLLDTQATVWLLNGDKRLPENIRENIEYRAYRYTVSVLSLMEIVQLMALKKISTKPLADIEEALMRYDVDIIGMNMEILEAFQQLPMLTIDGKLHSDPFDRILIAICIKHRFTMVSADQKFPEYRKHGLTLIEI